LMRVGALVSESRGDQDSSTPPALDGEASTAEHWWAGKDVDALIYRINRRPPAAGETLFGQPENLLGHLEEVLNLAHGTVETGRRFKRQWRIGNKVFDHEAGTFTGIVGWARSGTAWSSFWDEDAEAWVDRQVAADVSSVGPFAFIVDGRFLGVLRHSSFAEITVASVFKEFLNRGEQARTLPTTVWDVEPVGDEQQFYDWVASTDRLDSVELVFKRPNPDAEREFEDLFARLDALRAAQIREVISSDKGDRGLDKEALRTEGQTRAFIVAAMAAFGYIVGKGIVRGRRAVWDQRRRGARERIENVGATRETATEEVVEAVRRARDRRRQDHG
jgi:hypothetical protein